MIKAVNDKILQAMVGLQTKKWKAEGGVSLVGIIAIIIGLLFIAGVAALMLLGWGKIKTLWDSLINITFS